MKIWRFPIKSLGSWMKSLRPKFKNLMSPLKCFGFWWNLAVFYECLRSPMKSWILRWKSVFLDESLGSLMKDCGLQNEKLEVSDETRESYIYKSCVFDKKLGVSNEKLWCLLSTLKSVVSDKKLGVFYERLQSPMNYWGSPIKKLEASIFCVLVISLVSRMKTPYKPCRN